MTASRLRTVLTLAGVAFVYFVAGRVGLALAFVNQSASAVWPASGVAVTAAVLMGPVALPAIAVGAFFVNFSTSGHLLASVCIAFGNTLECVAAAAFTRRLGRGIALERRAAERIYLMVMTGPPSPLRCSHAKTESAVTVSMRSLNRFAFGWSSKRMLARLTSAPRRSSAGMRKVVGS